MVQEIEIQSMERQTSIEKSIETSKIIANVISHLITNENVLMISQDAKVKSERYITLNTNVDMSNAGEYIQGNRDPVYQ
jgi:hypothetical protein